MQTDTLIDQLSAQLTPVRPIAPPATRLAWWLLISLPALALVIWVFGLRPDLGARLADRRFLIEEAAALLTAVLAAYAALCAGLPDQPRWKIWLPAVPMMLWLGALGQQCLAVLVRLGSDGLRLTNDALCLPAIALGGLVPAIAITVMLRRSARFRTTHACLCGALAAAALGAAALRFYHMQDAAIMVLVWQVGSVALFSLIAGVASRVLAGRGRAHIPSAPA